MYLKLIAECLAEGEDRARCMKFSLGLNSSDLIGMYFIVVDVNRNDPERIIIGNYPQEVLRNLITIGLPYRSRSGSI